MLAQRSPRLDSGQGLPLLPPTLLGVGQPGDDGSQPQHVRQHEGRCRQHHGAQADALWVDGGEQPVVQPTHSSER